MVGVFREHLLDDLFEVGGNLLRKFKLFGVHDLNQFSDGVRLEGAHSENHLVEDNSERPDVCLIGVYLSSQDLGCHVDGRTEHGFGNFLRRT